MNDKAFVAVTDETFVAVVGDLVSKETVCCVGGKLKH